MTFHYYNPWKLGMLTESITIAVTPIEKLDTSQKYIVATNPVLTEQQDINESNFEVDWTEFYQKHGKETFALEIQTTDSIFMWAEGEEANKDWKWSQYGHASSKDITDDEFAQRIQHEGKVLVVTSVLCGGQRRFSNGDVEEVECNKEAWDFEDEDGTLDIVSEVRSCLYEGYYTFDIGDEFYQGLEYVVKNTAEIQGLDHLSKIELVKMGYEKLSDDMGMFSQVLKSIAERGTTSIYISAIDD